ncbi:hypothetical protein Tco_0053785 [Tanacetum coccineum]
MPQQRRVAAGGVDEGGATVEEMVVGVGYGEGSRDGEDGCGDEMMMTTIMGWQRGVVVVRRGCDCSSGCGTRLRGRRWWIWWRGGVEVIRMVSAGG